MYSKDQASAIRQAFWKAFGRYMALQSSAEGTKINWINYKTGIRHLSFKMLAAQNTACISIELSDPDAGIRALLYDQFLALKSILNGYLQEEWIWEPLVANENNQQVGRIRKCLPDANILKQEDWPSLISFFKPRMIALDAFWSEAQYGFELFR